ncbi:hypothetical protein GW17_00006469 [Ensete ventricosum]|nr:hypothetical protein GW17_00006469 [Ensete ventricosum]
MATTRRRRSIAALGDGRGVMAILFLLALLPLTPRCAAQPSAPSSNNSGPTNPTILSPSTATIIAVLISAFFFLAFFFVYIRQCANDDDASVQRVVYGTGAHSGRRRGAVGMSLEVLEMFPTMPYSDAKALKLGRGTLECAVCLSEFEDDETLRLLPGCCHVFHLDCIGVWLASHVTCPVCRADLSTVSLEQPPASSAAALAPDHVVVVVDQSPTEEETIELARIGSERREARSRRGRRSTKLPRSHSTGHSVAQPEEREDVDRYTLRLPEHIRREIFAARKFHRSTSCVAFPVTGEGSSRPGYRCGAAAGGEGSSRGGQSVRAGVSDRWPSFLIRTLSFTIPVWKRGDNEGSVKKGEAEGSSRGRFGGVRTPFDCLGGGGRGDVPGYERGPSQ